MIVIKKKMLPTVFFSKISLFSRTHCLILCPFLLHELYFYVIKWQTLTCRNIQLDFFQIKTLDEMSDISIYLVFFAEVVPVPYQNK